MTKIRFKSGVMIGLALLMAGCGNNKEVSEQGSIAQEPLRGEVYALVSSAENSSLDYEAQYAYIEDIDDGRGYTGGIIGFTSGTGDMLEVVQEYCKEKPEDNVLAEYIPALEAAVDSDSHEGLGDEFVSAWEMAAEDEEMRAAQDKILDEMYMSPAVTYGKEDGLSPLGQYIYYDALVVHGPGEDEDSFGGIRDVAMKQAQTPSLGGDETEYLLAFLDARTVIMQKEEAHSDLSRIETQQKFIREKNFDLSLPLEWMMYGDNFRLEE